MSDEAETETIEDPVDFFASLGGLHDVSINGLTIDVEEQVLLIYVDDLYWGLDGSPDYIAAPRGPHRGRGLRTA